MYALRLSSSRLFQLAPQRHGAFLTPALRLCSTTLTYCRNASTTECQRVLAEVDVARQQPLVYHASASQDDVSKKPLVILLGWLMSKQKHLDKFADWYLQRSIDAVSLLPRPSHVLSVDQAKSTAAAIVDVITHPHFATRPLVVHGFSIGGFLYGCTLLEIMERGVADDVASRLAAAVFDSPVDVEGIPFGVAAAQFGPGFRRDMTEKAVSALMKSNKSALELYNASAGAFKQNPLATPVHLLYSEADPITDTARIQEVVKNWRAKGHYVTETVFANSGHVQHMKEYYDMYSADLEAFVTPLLESVGPAASEWAHSAAGTETP